MAMGSIPNKQDSIIFEIHMRQRAVEALPDLPHYEKAVLTSMLRDGDRMRAAVETLAGRLSMSERHVQRVLTSLLKQKLIVASTPRRGGKPGTTTVFRMGPALDAAVVAWKKRRPADTGDGCLLVTPVTGDGCPIVTPGVTTDAETGDYQSPKALTLSSYGKKEEHGACAPRGAAAPPFPTTNTDTTNDTSPHDDLTQQLTVLASDVVQREATTDWTHLVCAFESAVQRHGLVAHSNLLRYVLFAALPPRPARRVKKQWTPFRRSA
jgi:hypothetical protein